MQKQYSIAQLAKLANISTRTLRWYDSCGLLPAPKNTDNGYRIYGTDEVNRLQQILFYRAMGFELNRIKSILDADGFNPLSTLLSHRNALLEKQKQLSLLISNVEKSIKNLKGDYEMTDKEKFEGFKDALISQNEETYGKEIREKYGDKEIDESNAHLKGMPKETLDKAQEIHDEFSAILVQAFETGDPAGPLAQKACDLHRQWLCIFYPKYTPQYHIAMGELYQSDPRFSAFYDKIAPGCAPFFCEAISLYCKDKI